MSEKAETSKTALVTVHQQALPSLSSTETVSTLITEIAVALQSKYTKPKMKWILKNSTLTQNVDRILIEQLNIKYKNLLSSYAATGPLSKDKEVVNGGHKINTQFSFFVCQYLLNTGTTYCTYGQVVSSFNIFKHVILLFVLVKCKFLSFPGKKQLKKSSCS